jgi:hypothetical protein
VTVLREGGPVLAEPPLQQATASQGLRRAKAYGVAGVREISFFARRCRTEESDPPSPRLRRGRRVTHHGGFVLRRTCDVLGSRTERERKGSAGCGFDRTRPGKGSAGFGQSAPAVVLIDGETIWVILAWTLIHAFGQQRGQQGERVPDTQAKCLGITKAGSCRQRIEPRQNQRRPLTNSRFRGGFFGWLRWHSARQCREARFGKRFGVRDTSLIEGGTRQSRITHTCAFARLGHLLSATINGWKKIPVPNLARRL